jgi:hypothetical protein
MTNGREEFVSPQISLTYQAMLLLPLDWKERFPILPLIISSLAFYKTLYRIPLAANYWQIELAQELGL